MKTLLALIAAAPPLTDNGELTRSAAAAAVGNLVR